ncbi:MAG: rubrerythrin family protein [Ignavibacteriae bacterium]|nr:rubrerythrin family protein [Ignavibacteriota bacterium]
MSFILLIAFASILSAAKPTKTIENLKSAIIGETTASAKYAAYSDKAKAEGFTKIALLFQAASKSESIHANNHKAVLSELGEKMADFKPEYSVKTTKENLNDAIKGESYEVATMYPEFLKTGQFENANLALISFNYAFQTEKKHAKLYKIALSELENGKENSLASTYYVCSTCGNTYEKEAPARCGISMTPKERFITIE